MMVLTKAVDVVCFIASPGGLTPSRGFPLVYHKLRARQPSFITRGSRAIQWWVSFRPRDGAEGGLVLLALQKGGCIHGFGAWSFVHSTDDLMT